MRKKNIFNSINKKSLFKYLSEYQSLNYCFPFIYNRYFIIKNNLFFDNFRHAEDFIFVTKVFCLMKKFEILSNLLINHKFNPRGLSSKSNLENDYVYLRGIKDLDDFFTEKKYLFEKQKYIFLRKKNLFLILCLRTLKYELDTICDYSNLISKKGKISVKNNFLSQTNELNYCFLSQKSKKIF